MRPKQTVMFQGSQSMNQLEFTNWAHPLPREGEEVDVRHGKTRIRGQVRDVFWSIDGAHAQGNVAVTIYVSDCSEDDNRKPAPTARRSHERAAEAWRSEV